MQETYNLISKPKYISENCPACNSKLVLFLSWLNRISDPALKLQIINPDCCHEDKHHHADNFKDATDDEWICFKCQDGLYFDLP
jgi:hypothetical protein